MISTAVGSELDAFLTQEVTEGQMVDAFQGAYVRYAATLRGGREHGLHAYDRQLHRKCHCDDRHIFQANGALPIPIVLRNVIFVILPEPTDVVEVCGPLPSIVTNFQPYQVRVAGNVPSQFPGNVNKLFVYFSGCRRRKSGTAAGSGTDGSSVAKNSRKGRSYRSASSRAWRTVGESAPCSHLSTTSGVTPARLAAAPRLRCLQFRAQRSISPLKGIGALFTPGSAVMPLPYRENANDWIRVRNNSPEGHNSAPFIPWSREPCPRA